MPPKRRRTTSNSTLLREKPSNIPISLNPDHLLFYKNFIEQNSPDLLNQPPPIPTLTHIQIIRYSRNPKESRLVDIPYNQFSSIAQPDPFTFEPSYEQYEIQPVSTLPSDGQFDFGIILYPTQGHTFVGLWSNSYLPTLDVPANYSVLVTIPRIYQPTSRPILLWTVSTFFIDPVATPSSYRISLMSHHDYIASIQFNTSVRPDVPSEITVSQSPSLFPCYVQ